MTINVTALTEADIPGAVQAIQYVFAPSETDESLSPLCARRDGALASRLCDRG